MKSIMETEQPQRSYLRSLLAIAEVIKAIVEEMSEQEIEPSTSQHQFRRRLFDDRSLSTSNRN
jgi:hypothetical protein